MASVTTQKMRAIDTLVDQLVGDGSYPRSNGTGIKEQAKAVVNNLLHLTPVKGTFTTNTGEVQTLLKMHGVVPTEFQGVTYQTPIELWLPNSFPSTAPIIYVRPTSNMAIAHGHKHVDMSGLVHIPGLTQWDASSSSVVMAIMEMCSLFSSQPPLRARPTGPVAPAPATPSPATGSALGPGPSYQPVHHPPGAGGSGLVGAAGGWGGPQPAPAPPAHGGITRQQSMDNEVEKARYRKMLTEQIQVEMRELLQSMGQDIDKEYELQGELDRNAQRLQQHKDALAAHTAKLVAHEVDLNGYVDDISLRVAQAERRSITPSTAPDLVGPGDVLSKQLLDTVAEAAAIEDAYAVLAKALEEGVLPADVFVRECRRRARRQFELKCLAETIHAAQARQHALAQPQRHTLPPAGGFAAAAAGGAPHAPTGGGMVYHTGSVPGSQDQEWVVVGQAGHGGGMYPPHK